jgi:hypothetical protein
LSKDRLDSFWRPQSVGQLDVQALDALQLQGRAYNETTPIGAIPGPSCPISYLRLSLDLPTRRILGRRKWQFLKILFYKWFALGLPLFVEPQTMNQIKLAVTIHSHDWTAALGTDNIARGKIPWHSRVSFRAADVPRPKAILAFEKGRGFWPPLPRSFLSWLPSPSFKAKKCRRGRIP